MRVAGFVVLVLVLAAHLAARASAGREQQLDYRRLDPDPLAIPYSNPLENAVNDLFDQAGVAMHEGRLAVAASALEQLVMKDSGAIEAFLMLGDTYMRMGRFEEALRVCKAVMKVPPAAAPATLLAMRSLNAMGRHAEAAEMGRHFAEGRVVDPLLRLEERMARVRSGGSSGVLNEFAGELQERAQASGTEGEMVGAAIFYLASGNASAAEQCLNTVYRTFGNTQLGLAARLLMTAGRRAYPEALALALKATESPVQTADTWNNLAVLLSVSNQFTEARACLEKALAIDAGHFPALHQLTSILVKAGDVTGAVEVCRRAAQVNSNSAALNHRMGQLLIQQQDWSAAHGYLLRSQSIRPDLKGPSYLLGLLAQSRGDENTAVQLYERELALNTNHVQTLNNLAWIKATSTSTSLHNLSQAAALARRACELTGFESVEEIDTLVECLKHQKNYDEARRVVALALSSSTKAPEATVLRLKSIATTLNESKESDLTH